MYLVFIVCVCTFFFFERVKGCKDDIQLNKKKVLFHSWKLIETLLMHIKIVFKSTKYYDIKKSNAFSLLLSNLSSASDICCSSNPKSSSSFNGIKCSII